MLSKIKLLWIQYAKHNSDLQKLSISLGTLFLYIIIFAIFYPQQNTSIIAFTILPVALIAWLYGLRIGVVVGLLSFGLNTLLLNMFGQSGLGVVIEADGGSNFIVLMILSIMIGKVSDNYTEIKRTQAQLTQKHDLLIATVDTIPVEVFTKDQQGRFIFANAATRANLKATRHEDYLGKTDFDFMYDNREIAQYYFDDEQEIIRTGKPKLNQEYARTDLNGNTVWSLSNKTPYYDKDGSIMGIVGSNQRITERKKMEEALRQSEANLLMALKAAEMRTWHWDLSNNQLSIKGVELPGFEKSIYQTTYQEFLKTIEAEDRPKIQQAFKDILEKKILYDVEYRVKSTDGLIHWITSKGDIEQDENGTPIAINGISYDITQQKQADEQRLDLILERERIHLLTNFISQASHEFKTPLSIISTNTYLLQNIDDVDRQKNYCHKINEQVKNINLLIENLTTLSKLDSGEVITTEVIDLNQIIADIYKSKQTRIQAQGIGSVLNLTDDPVFVSGDVDYLNQAIIHIFDNAIHHTLPDEHITIRSHIIENTAIVEINDTGSGIDDADIPHIFNRFYRADKAGSTRGFGLGLPIAKVIVERLGGQIEATSEFGKGSLFRITLPLIQQSEPTP